MMNMQQYPNRKLIDLLLLEHRNQPWKINHKITYPRFLPHAKKHIEDWIANNLHGPVQLLMTEMLNTITNPKKLESRYKKLHPDIWRILSDSTIREQLELDYLYCYSPEETHRRLIKKIKPRS